MSRPRLRARTLALTPYPNPPPCTHPLTTDRTPTPNQVQASAAGGHSYDHMRFYATRDIGRGEALAFSYLSSAACFEERRQTTAAEYCFRCECERCSAAAVAAAAAAAPTGASAAAASVGTRTLS